MKLIKSKHSLYPETMSASKTIFKTKNVHYTVQEYYGSLHYISLDKWVRNEEDLFVLKKWRHIPLNMYTFKLFRLFTKEDKVKLRIDKIKSRIERLSAKEYGGINESK